jgi:hypothetical protein
LKQVTGGLQVFWQDSFPGHFGDVCSSAIAFPPQSRANGCDPLLDRS